MKRNGCFSVYRKLEIGSLLQRQVKIKVKLNIVTVG